MPYFFWPNPHYKPISPVNNNIQIFLGFLGAEVVSTSSPTVLIQILQDHFWGAVTILISMIGVTCLT